ncbi:MAG: hypothetical protein CM1200mP36_01920 [Gammaproteobacteria bacterium]|nr:MAG: hypothetical protein CM1200mP36_01920 [Gammaproteobacteria bacterium]
MTEALIAGLRPGQGLQKALEIGTGCGYQSAVLAPFAQHLYSVERQRPLIRRARERLSQLKINNVTLRHADGWRGWKSQAPFQGILVAASPRRFLRNSWSNSMRAAGWLSPSAGGTDKDCSASPAVEMYSRLRS